MDGDFESIRYFSRGKKRARKERKKWSAFRRWSIILTAVGAAILTISIIVLNAVTPFIIDTAKAKIKTMSTLAVNNAIFEVMTTSVSYNDLITITKDASGSIRLISANTQLINKLALDTSLSASAYITKMSQQGVGISLGTMSGVAALAGKGPEINVRTIPSSSVVCEFLSEFDEAGINQTRHKIFLEVLTLVILVLPGNHVEIYNTTQVLISENIIVGEVPETFLRISSLGGTAYDLIPK